MSFFYGVVLVCAIISARIYKSSLKNLISLHRIPKVTIVFSTVLLFTSIAQYFHPQLLDLFERNTTLIFSGQFWRVLTSIFFQDGGITGAVFNIVSLLFIGGTVEQYVTKRQWLFLFFGGALATQVIAQFWQPIGAGNSIANFSLAGSLLVMTFLHNNPRTRIISSIGLGVSAVLLFLQDIHGAAVFIGMLLWVAVNKGKSNEGDRRGSNPRHLAPQASALPAELRPPVLS